MIRLGAMGDVVRTLPAVSRLRAGYPLARITWLVERGAEGVLEKQPWIDEVLVFPRQELDAALRRGQIGRLSRRVSSFVAELRRRRFDLSIDFHANLKSGLLAALSGAPLRASYARPVAKELAWLFANRRARLPRAAISRFERNDALVHYLGLSQPAAQPAFVLQAEAVERLGRLLPDSEELAVIHPGSSARTPYKRYRPESYAAVARGLFEQRVLRSAVSFGPSAGEREIALAVVREAGDAAFLAPETPSLADLAALFSRCRLFIGSDSGPLHVASLVGTPVVQLLGPTHPVENAPYPETASRSLRVPLACSPCRRGCGPATCMRAISPESVLASAHELLGEGAAGEPPWR